MVNFGRRLHPFPDQNCTPVNNSTSEPISKGLNVLSCGLGLRNKAQTQTQRLIRETANRAAELLSDAVSGHFLQVDNSSDVAEMSGSLELLLKPESVKELKQETLWPQILALAWGAARKRAAGVGMPTIAAPSLDEMICAAAAEGPGPWLPFDPRPMTAARWSTTLLDATKKFPSRTDPAYDATRDWIPFAALRGLGYMAPEEVVTKEFGIVSSSTAPGVQGSSLIPEELSWVIGTAPTAAVFIVRNSEQSLTEPFLPEQGVFVLSLTHAGWKDAAAANSGPAVMKNAVRELAALSKLRILAVEEAVNLEALDELGFKELLGKERIDVTVFAADPKQPGSRKPVVAPKDLRQLIERASVR